MERNDPELAVAESVPAKAAWVAPKAVETDIAAITSAFNPLGSANDGVTTGS